MVGTDFFENGQPIHFRHVKIENGDARGLLAEEGQAFDPARGRQHLIPMSGEGGLDQLAVYTIVADDQDFDQLSFTGRNAWHIQRASI